MCSGNRHNPPVLQEMLLQPLWARRVGDIVIQYVFNRRITARQCVTDNYNVRLRLQVLHLIAFHQSNTLRLELCAHGRIHIGIRTGHFMTRLFGQYRNTPHEGSADAEDMNMHDSIVPGTANKILPWQSGYKQKKPAYPPANLSTTHAGKYAP